MSIIRSEQEIEALWTKARAANDNEDPDEFAEGVYETLQWLEGTVDEMPLSDVDDDNDDNDDEIIQSTKRSGR